MMPRVGRASYLGERAVGEPDGGAVAVACWLRALTPFVMERVSILGKQNPKLTLSLADAPAVFVFVVDSFGHYATAIMVLY
ncbi:DAK2 domain-containing protein [Paraburkholderia sp. Tr-20389]|uniref:DAK2 domain-containing protein n=1 Tax=Paraburkholderia sp. Tr-20389 TaxID=2703903 RepID=UPI001F11DADD|nr:DAK2 domain-containing protein [Paraburkholderia sp. Tr-20389]